MSQSLPLLFSAVHPLYSALPYDNNILPSQAFPVYYTATVFCLCRIEHYTSGNPELIYPA